MTLPVERHTGRGILLVVAAVLAGALIVTAFAFRAWQTGATDRKLCLVVRQLVTSSGRPPASAPGYFKDHPEDLARAQRLYDKALRDLDCDHLPSTGGTP